MNFAIGFSAGGGCSSSSPSWLWGHGRWRREIHVSDGRLDGVKAVLLTTLIGSLAGSLIGIFPWLPREKGERRKFLSVLFCHGSPR
ncbi:MAG: hypothetical protein MZU91_04930 [Desulfosudis oleivorans]|nr:hypothetical protein [Desulfosudis oleivorans]